MSDSPLTIIRVPIGRLHADPGNANTHDERNLRQIRDSLREFGQVEPLVVQKGTGKVIGGNGRLEVMRDEGVHEVDIVEFEGSEIRAVALSIALNRPAKTSVFDDTILAEQLRALQSEDFPTTSAGFTDEEVDELLQSLGNEALGGNGEVAQDEPPPLDKAAELQEKWGTAAGQLWVVPSLTTPGRSHRLLCGDCTKADDVARLMDGEKAVLIVTDPPYGVEFVRGQYISDKSRKSKMSAPASIVGDDLKGDDQREFVRTAFSVYRHHVEAGASVYMFSAPMIEGCCSWFGMVDAGVHVQSQLIWAKNNHSLGQADHHWKHEVCWYGWYDTGTHRWYGGRDKFTVIECDRVQATLHPNEKPTDLIAGFLQNSSLRGDLVAEPFGGSGTTLVAAEQEGRVAFAMETDPKFVAVTLERLSNLGLDPQLEA
jgi:DNA modification methylase